MSGILGDFGEAKSGVRDRTPAAVDTVIGLGLALPLLPARSPIEAQNGEEFYNRWIEIIDARPSALFVVPLGDLPETMH